MMPPIAILAGGTATRLRPLTENMPKAMLEVAGEPFIAHQLRLFAREGIKDVKLLVGHCWEQIADFVGDGSRFGLRVDYIPDGPKLLGTGGSIRRALDRLGPEFLVIYGDSWLDSSYGPIVSAFRASGQPALMCVFHNENRWDKSNIVFENGLIRCYSKKLRLPEMGYIDWGLSMLSASALAPYSPDEAWDLGELYEKLSLAGRLAGYEVTQRFYEIGSFDGLAETDELLRATQAAR
ncbi:MAG TPA: sugar phosphate nucleotidyltransferase [Methylovirgula sp.]|nr:sugar phosphate nucleotidyltransferase [Methylovirgula sp.]